MNTLTLRLSKAQRLRSPSDFQQVYRSKQFGVSQHHSFNVLRESKPHPPFSNRGSVRLGVTVSKKVSKKAVVRNSLKRQIKEFYRTRQHQLHTADLVITARPSCASANQSEREQSLRQLWKKILKWQRWNDSNNVQAKHNA